MDSLEQDLLRSLQDAARYRAIKKRHLGRVELSFYDGENGLSHVLPVEEWDGALDDLMLHDPLSL